MILPTGNTTVVQANESNSIEELINMLKSKPTSPNLLYFMQLADGKMVPVYEDHILLNYPDLDKLIIGNIYLL